MYRDDSCSYAKTRTIFFLHLIRPTGRTKPEDNFWDSRSVSAAPLRYHKQCLPDY
jgi:hypothetical protein